MKHIVCFSGGHSSAIVAIEVVRKFGKENVVLLNHNISDTVESEDIKRFKKEVANYLQLPITEVNYKNLESENLPDQFDLSLESKAFKLGAASTICTSRLKTEPFYKYLSENFEDKNCIIYYGFDKNEKHRVQRRSSILSSMGYKTDFPLALWEDRTITNTEEINIAKPNVYSQFKHANCIGCIKGGKQHWYVVFNERPDIWEKAKFAENQIGYSITDMDYLEDLEEDFIKMKELGIPATENIQQQTFWAMVRKKLKTNLVENDNLSKPCECSE